LDKVGELRVYLHFGENSAADDDFSARVAFPSFICGFLFERVEPPFDFSPLLFELFDPLSVTLWHWLSDQEVMLGYNSTLARARFAKPQNSPAPCFHNGRTEANAGFTRGLFRRGIKLDPINYRRGHRLSPRRRSGL
jgi:hypothetical protein